MVWDVGFMPFYALRDLGLQEFRSEVLNRHEAELTHISPTLNPYDFKTPSPKTLNPKV